jgi:UDP-N-acetylmuramyl pentapeptide phosphotransferase/UDP-N-acetylglucosamine-1-phosphate transferase
MAYAMWLAPLGWGIFFIGLIASIVIFSVKRKFYPIMYLISIATYIFTIGFVIDAFDLGKDSTLLILALSAIVFISLGFYFNKKFSKEESEFVSKIPSRK